MSDFLCLEDLDPLCSEVDARTAYIQDIYHVLFEDPGTNIDDRDRGLGMQNWLSSAYNEQWPAQVERECKRFDETKDAVCTIEIEKDGRMLVSIELTTDDEKIKLEVALDSANGTTFTVLE